jgi:hypothetical protein
MKKAPFDFIDVRGRFALLFCWSSGLVGRPKQGLGMFSQLHRFICPVL